jgi:hypothetical protein
MPRRLLLLLLFALLAGVGAGLYVGWVAVPVEYVDASPASLHQSFKDDYLLMIAVAYAADGDLPAARSAVAALGFSDPAAAVTAAAGRLAATGLPAADQDRLAALAAALAAPVP